MRQRDFLDLHSLRRLNGPSPEGREGAGLSQDLSCRMFGKVNLHVRFGDLLRVGCFVRRMHGPTQSILKALHQQLGTALRQPIMQRSHVLILLDRHFSLREDPTMIKLLRVESLHADACFGIAVEQSAVDGCRPAIPRKQRRVEIDSTMLESMDDMRRYELPKGYRNGKVSLQGG